MNGAVRAKARMVQNLKDKKEEEDKHKKEKTQKKTVDVKRKREEAFTNLLTLLQTSEAPIADVLGTLTTDKLKLVYQHIGGAVSKLPNGRKDTFVTVLAQRKELSRPAPSWPTPPRPLCDTTGPTSNGTAQSTTTPSHTGTTPSGPNTSSTTPSSSTPSSNPVPYGTIPPMPELPTAPAANCESRKLDKDDMAVVETLTNLFTKEVDKKVDEGAGDSFQTMEM